MNDEAAVAKIMANIPAENTIGTVNQEIESVSQIFLASKTQINVATKAKPKINDLAVNTRIDRSNTCIPS